MIISDLSHEKEKEESLTCIKTFIKKTKYKTQNRCQCQESVKEEKLKLSASGFCCKKITISDMKV